MRHGLCKDLGFSPEDRTENIRRIGELVKLFIEAGVIAITAFISPYRNDRRRIRSLLQDNQFIEIFVDCPIEVCAKREKKGIYEKAKAVVIKGFTGISAPYERPERPDLIIDSGEEDASAAAKRIPGLLKKKNIHFKGIQ